MNVKEGDFIGYTQYFKVKSVDYGRVFTVDTKGKDICITPDIVEESFNSGSYYEEEKKVTLTELAKILSETDNTLFTVNFVKANGEERTLIGHRVGTENYLGRTNVIDLEHQISRKKGIPLRQVDHRTLKWLIYKGTKYSVK